MLTTSELEKFYETLLIQKTLRVFTLSEEEQFFSYLKKQKKLHNISLDYGRSYTDFYVRA